jgi:hypothetical protein
METILSIFAGAFGYLAVNFWIRPIKRYYDLKHDLVVDQIFYANAVNPAGMNDYIHEQHAKRVLAFRKHSAAFLACFQYLPWWFKFFILSKRGEEPCNASPELMGLSNTCDYDDAAKRVEKIRKYLRIDLPL